MKDSREQILQQRLEVLEHHLKNVEQARSWEQFFPEVRIPDDIWVTLDDTIGRKARDLLRTVSEIKDNDNLQFAWTQYREVYEQSKPLFREFLELLGGLVFRDKAVDDSICLIADELIRNCAVVTRQPSSLTVPAPTGALSRTMGRLIHLRYPEWSIWTLPFAAHEYGHVVLEPQMPKLTAGLEPLFAEEDRPALAGLATEAFASYIMGPAYACAAIVLRLDPLTAYTSDPEGPAPDTRERVILGVLSRMSNEGVGEPPYQDVIRRLHGYWQDMIKLAGPPGAPRMSEEQLNAFLKHIWTNVFNYFPTIAQYPHTGRDGWVIARKWSDNWSEQLRASVRDTPTTKDVSGASKVRDVLNAAWLCRIYGEPEWFDQIEAAARNLYRSIKEEQAKDQAKLPEIRLRAGILSGSRK